MRVVLHRFAIRLLLPLGACLAAASSSAQPVLVDADMAETRRALTEARTQGAAAGARAQKLEAQAAKVTEAAERTARESAAVAARIQQTEADIAAHQARIRLIGRERVELRARLARRQQPLVRLTAALQRLSRRPPVLALLRPGSVRDTMHLRALLASMLPEVERRIAGLRIEIERSRALERQARDSARQLAASEVRLRERRKALASLETRQRLASREVAGIASRESERALALAEKARDLDELTDEIGRAGALREALSRLPGPVLRPRRPEESQVAATESPAATAPGLGSYMLPVAGRLVTGFGDAREGQPRSRGIALVTRAGAQAVAPAPGRVAFAGPYRGFGRIVIIEHAGGWTTLVTGLAQLDARVGEKLVAGSPLGIAGAGRPVVTLELRQDGEPVNPLAYMRAL